MCVCGGSIGLDGDYGSVRLVDVGEFLLDEWGRLHRRTENGGRNDSGRIRQMVGLRQRLEM
jgi:hypothetical protein